MFLFVLFRVFFSSLPKISIKKKLIIFCYSLTEILHCALTTTEPCCSIFGMCAITLLRKQSFCNDTVCLGLYNFKVEIKRHWLISTRSERKREIQKSHRRPKTAGRIGQRGCTCCDIRHISCKSSLRERLHQVTREILQA